MSQQPTPILTRDEAIHIVCGELDYAEAKWNPDTTPSGGVHSALEWLTYMETYIREAQSIATHESDATADAKVMAAIRKVTGLGLSAMQTCGCPRREGY